MQNLQFKINITRTREGVRVEVLTPDGELQDLGEIQQPAQIPMLVNNAASYLALTMVNAVWEVRSA